MDSLNKRVVSLDELMPLIRERLSAGQSVRFLPRGTSMLPLLRQGRDSVILSPLTQELRKYDIPLYQRADGHYVLHRIVAIGDTYTCIGDNQFEPEQGLKPEQMIAVVSGFTRDGKEHSVEEVPYRVYCRIWHYSRLVRKQWRRIKRIFRRIIKKAENEVREDGKE